jgi:hypothetical protein
MITWTKRDGVFNATHMGLRAVVGRLDGRNWGYIIVAREGAVLQGLVNATHDVASAKELAENALIDLRQPVPTP